MRLRGSIRVLHGLEAFTRSRSRATDLNHGLRRVFALDDLRDAMLGIYAWDLSIIVGSLNSGRLKSKDNIQGSKIERVHLEAILRARKPSDHCKRCYLYYVPRVRRLTCRC
jgi:hypothetical protein